MSVGTAVCAVGCLHACLPTEVCFDGYTTHSGLRSLAPRQSISPEHLAHSDTGSSQGERARRAPLVSLLCSYYDDPLLSLLRLAAVKKKVSCCLCACCRVPGQSRRSLAQVASRTTAKTNNNGEAGFWYGCAHSEILPTTNGQLGAVSWRQSSQEN